MWKLLPGRSLRARAQFSFQRAVDVMAVSAELGHRQQGGGFRISWEVGKSSKTGPGLGTGRGGQAPGSRGVRVWQQERSSEWKARQAVWCLVCSVTACWLGLVSAATGRQGAYLSWPLRWMGPRRPKPSGLSKESRVQRLAHQKSKYK